jgi:hypothetical protein
VNSEHLSVKVDPARFRWCAIDVTRANRMPGDHSAAAKLCRFHHAGQEIHTLRDALIGAKGQL